MISSDLRKKIFVSVPLSFECACGTFAVHKEYAPYAKVTEYLKQNPTHFYIALDFADDEIYRDETPRNYVWDYNMSKTKDDTPLEPITEYEMTYGTRNRCVLNMHVYATWQPNYTNMIQAMEEVLAQLQFWAILDLEQIVDYPEISSIQEIDETTDRIMHRIVSITFTYTAFQKRLLRTINAIELTENSVNKPLTDIVLINKIIAEPTDWMPKPEEDPRGHVSINRQ